MTKAVSMVLSIFLLVAADRIAAYLRRTGLVPADPAAGMAGVVSHEVQPTASMASHPLVESGSSQD
ncbi:MAG: hypothetical protein JWR19_3202 [Pedosphaera sp.]|nr:hypothetical protein [Pedosphaera sp.]